MLVVLRFYAMNIYKYHPSLTFEPSSAGVQVVIHFCRLALFFFIILEIFLYYFRRTNTFKQLISPESLAIIEEKVLFIVSCT